MKLVSRKLIVLIGVLTLIVGLIPLDRSSIAQAASSTRSGPAAPHKPDIDCATSPFGPVLTIGGEKEIFVGYRGGSAPNSGWLAYSRLDVITSTGALAHQDTWLGGSISSTLTNVAQVTGVATDLNGDGKSEFVQSYYDNVTPYNLVAHRNGLTPSFWKPSFGSATRQQIRAVAGDVTGDSKHDGEIVLTSRFDTTDPTAPNGALDVRIINGNSEGGFTTDPAFNPLAFWRSAQVTRTFGSLINSTVGDLDGDGIGEIVVAFDEGSAIQLIVLEYMPGYSLNEGNSGVVATNLKEMATWRLDAIGTPNNLKLATGNLEGDFDRELVLAYDHDDSSNPGFSDQINVRTYHVQITPTVSIAEKSHYLWNDETTQQLALTTADTDQDALDEIIVAARTFNSPTGLVVRTLDAEQSTIFVHNTMRDDNNFRSSFFNLEMDAGDLDRDGQADIVAAFRDQGSQLQVIRVADEITATTGMTITSAWRDGTQGRTNASNVSLSLGDWNDDSLRAVYAPATGGTILCKSIEEPQLTSAIFVPPYWKNIQADQDKYGTVGKARSTSVTTETAVTNESSHSFSAYVGVGASGSLGPLEVSASVRATGGYEFSAGKRRANATTTGQTIQEGWSNTGEGFVAYDTTAYNCYSYQLRISGADQDGHSRFCEVTGLTQKAREFDAWDNQNGLDELEKYQWAPIARDWTNLALFRRVTETVQSSTSAGGEAARAVDGNLDGNYNNSSVSHTADEASPWWQTDLGSSQAIGKIRLWNRTDCCSDRLADYYVFVSNTDFRSISNDPNALIADSRVRTYTQTLNSGRVTTILALDNALNPITGRYVRVQLRNTGTARPLSLAEVQVFGTNHVEPDRYPTAVRDVNPNDGYFEVKIFNRTTQSFQWVPVRGKLLWNGAAENVLANTTIGPGNVTKEWSL
ncbi:MAG TPA: discoidin domain-containing protein, partial [Anaerolineae bacterium]|nr:discoidin domain-containing protein [Anaerolineae bacterium]